MKLPATLALFLFTGFSVAAQVPDYESVPLHSNADFKQAESTLLAAANYVLSVPLDNTGEDRLKSLQFVLKWMTGTPDYSFSLDPNLLKYFKKNDDLLGVFMAAQSKYAVENNVKNGEQHKVNVNALAAIVAYCENPANNVKQTKQIKDLIEAKANGGLDKMIN